MIDTTFVCPLCGKTFDSIVIKSIHMHEDHTIDYDIDDSREQKRVRFYKVIDEEEEEDAKSINRKK